MSYARFSYADVYVFMNTGGWLECCGCSLGDEGRFDSTQAMVDHLAQHRAAGDDVPDGIEDSLWADDRENWVDYQRCDLDGCDERAACGTPSAGGYISTCSIAHARAIDPETFEWLPQ